MTDFDITRRQLLVGTGTVALVGLVAGAGEVDLAQYSRLAFLDGLLSADEMSVGRRAFAPFSPDVLGLDLVRQWRDELHSHIARGVQLIAITRWDKALLLRELAREVRLAAKQERIATSLFRTQISLRG